MKYKIIRKTEYDFIGQSYKSVYPNIHKYPATMLPQIGINILKELKISNGKLLDPYCGSGSSFISGIDVGIKELHGFDINPLAILISSTKYNKINIKKIKMYKDKLREAVYEFYKKEENIKKIKIPSFYNIDFWFSKNVLNNIGVIKYFIDKIEDKNLKRFFLVPFSETVRECSYTRNNEFKLYKMKSEEVLNFNPDVFCVYFNKLNQVIDIYEKYYLPKLKDVKVSINYDKFNPKESYYDVVLTSPPYGDSKTTVAYGQFSLLSNEWLGINYARNVDNRLMGGKTVYNLYVKGLMCDYIKEISKQSIKRAKEVSSFYFDLEESIYKVADSVKKGGKSIYVVGNRRVKNIQLPTDQFIAEKFEEKGFKHLFTYERILGNKAMPSKNSPSNKIGQRISTITTEYIVVCEKVK